MQWDTEFLQGGTEQTERMVLLELDVRQIVSNVLEYLRVRKDRLASDSRPIV